MSRDLNIIAENGESAAGILSVKAGSDFGEYSDRVRELTSKANKYLEMRPRTSIRVIARGGGTACGEVAFSFGGGKTVLKEGPILKEARESVCFLCQKHWVCFDEGCPGQCDKTCNCS